MTEQDIHTAPSVNSLLRVLHVGPLPPPVGGIASVLESLVAALASQCEVRVLDNQKTTPADRSAFSGMLAQMMLLSRLLLTCLNWSPDVVHIHTCSWFSFWRNMLDVFIARLCGRKVVLHIHGGQFHKFLDSLNTIQRLLVRITLAHCQGVVVLGQRWKELLVDWCDEDKLHAIANGVAMQPRATIKNEECRILCLANYTANKGQADLIKAVAVLATEQDIHVDLLGVDTDPVYREELEHLAGQLGLADKVAIPGPKMGSDKQAYMNGATIFCLPSYDEGLPMSMLEAMAASIPVIVTRVGAIPEVVIDRQNGCLYEAGDIEELTSAIEYLLEDQGRAEQIGSDGYDSVEKQYSLDAFTASILDVYKEIVPSI